MKQEIQKLFDNQSATAIDLKSQGLTTKDLEEIAELLPKVPDLTELDLFNNEIDSLPIKFIQAVIQRKPEIDIFLTENPCESEWSIFKLYYEVNKKFKLMKQAHYEPNVENIFAQLTAIKTSISMHFNLMQKLKTLATQTQSDNFFLAEISDLFRNTEKLTISYADDFSLWVLANALKKPKLSTNQGLQILHLNLPNEIPLESTGLTDYFVEIFKHIKVIEIKGASLTKEFAAAIANAAAADCKLKSIQLTFNSYPKPDALLTLLSILKNNPQLQIDVKNQFSIKNNIFSLSVSVDCTSEFLKNLAERLAAKKDWEKIELNRNILKKEFELFLTTFSTNIKPFIIRLPENFQSYENLPNSDRVGGLDISSQLIYDAHIESLKKAFSSWPELTYLNASKIEFKGSTIAKSSLQEKFFNIFSNTPLKELDISNCPTLFSFENNLFSLKSLQLSHLEIINLSGNEKPAKDAPFTNTPQLIQFLNILSNTQLKKIDLSHRPTLFSSKDNPFPLETWQLLHLETINLSNTPPANIYQLIQFIQNNKKLTSINLSKINFSDSDLEKLSLFLEESAFQLKEIILFPQNLEINLILDRNKKNLAERLIEEREEVFKNLKANSGKIIDDIKSFKTNLIHLENLQKQKCPGIKNVLLNLHESADKILIAILKNETGELTTKQQLHELITLCYQIKITKIPFSEKITNRIHELFDPNPPPGNTSNTILQSHTPPVETINTILKPQFDNISNLKKSPSDTSKQIREILDILNFFIQDPIYSPTFIYKYYYEYMTSYLRARDFTNAKQQLKTYFAKAPRSVEEDSNLILRYVEDYILYITSSEDPKKLDGIREVVNFIEKYLKHLNEGTCTSIRKILAGYLVNVSLLDDISYNEFKLIYATIFTETLIKKSKATFNMDFLAASAICCVKGLAELKKTQGWQVEKIKLINEAKAEETELKSVIQGIIRDSNDGFKFGSFFKSFSDDEIRKKLTDIINEVNLMMEKNQKKENTIEEALKNLTTEHHRIWVEWFNLYRSTTKAFPLLAIDFCGLCNKVMDEPVIPIYKITDGSIPPQPLYEKKAVELLMNKRDPINDGFIIGFTPQSKSKNRIEQIIGKLKQEVEQAKQKATQLKSQSINVNPFRAPQNQLFIEDQKFAEQTIVESLYVNETANLSKKYNAAKDNVSTKDDTKKSEVDNLTDETLSAHTMR